MMTLYLQATNETANLLKNKEYNWIIADQQIDDAADEEIFVFLPRDCIRPL